MLAILVLGWLPRRTVESMNRVVEHREDKYSPSLHLVDANSGTGFCDNRHLLSEGELVRSEQANVAVKPALVAQSATSDKEQAEIARIRRLRREAARRRSVISVSLLVITVAVFVLSFVLGFSALFVLIPAAVLVVVLVCGVRAASHARSWERNLCARRKAEAKHRSGEMRKRNDKAANNRAEAVSEDGEPTGTMEQHEIEQALRAAKMEKERIMQLRANRQSGQNRKNTSAEVQSSDGGADKDSVTSASVPNATAEKFQTQSATRHRPMEQSNRDSKVRKDAHRAGSVSETKARAETSVAEPSDATYELQQVHPAPALDLVDLVPNQDLISFSLGSPRNGAEVKSEEPKSLEIKSTRQVAKAKAKTKDDSQPVSAKQGQTKAADAFGIATKSNERSHAKVAVGNGDSETVESRDYAGDSETFHASELSADTEAPAVSSDSLGTGLEKIFERRNV
ncbi:hypothetical protein [Bifidobacterium commune]|uniref:hypothetical protein n=1 Tax=Bifidobacterium commune TaxID=1505727 RepID=UPI0040586425